MSLDKITLQIERAFAALKDVHYCPELGPRAFAAANLDALAKAGVYPENAMAGMYRAHADKLIRPLLWDDAEFESALNAHVQRHAWFFEKTIDQHHFDQLGIENINFFIYCVCMIL